MHCASRVPSATLADIEAQPHSTYTDGGDLARSSNGGRSIAAIGCTLLQRGSRARQRSVYSDEPQYHENHCASMGCSFPALRRKLHHRIGLIVGLPLLAMPEPSKALAVRESRVGKKMYDVVRYYRTTRRSNIRQASQTIVRNRTRIVRILRACRASTDKIKPISMCVRYCRTQSYAPTYTQSPFAYDGLGYVGKPPDRTPLEY